MGLVGVMQTWDGRWRAEVGGVGSIVWYRLIGPNGTRALPSTCALLDSLNAAGVDLGDLAEVASDLTLASTAQGTGC
ncbi:hypothetical protein ACQEVZ_58775 [Dactylosporangium sp. CA-152071]|uniref:hypothetical protein n=1 Tax=Dactylosporangium sp. CA-152071 TaxID=3239933 RepID=UPI003D8A04FB